MNKYRKQSSYILGLVAVFSINAALACGPEYVPRYQPPSYFDPDQEAYLNFNILLNDYVKPQEPRRWNSHSEQQNQYLVKLAKILINSGRKISLLIKNNSVQQLYCLGDEFNCLDFIEFAALPQKFNSQLNDFDDYYSGGSCFSNSTDNVLNYISQLLATKISDQRVIELIQARESLANYRCKAVPAFIKNYFESILLKNYASDEDRDFSHYLIAADLFYQARYSEAMDHFASLTNSSNQWIAETAEYLAARDLLIQSQKNWNGYQEPEKAVDKTLTATSQQGFERYLAKYPQGRYAISAQGLLRRINYLTGKQHAYAGQIAGLMYHAARLIKQESNDANSQLFMQYFTEWRQHTDSKVDYAQAVPILIAYDIFYSRESAQDLLAKLNNSALAFKDDPTLLLLLKNYLFYRLANYQDIAHSDLPTSFSRQVDLGLGIIRAKTDIKLGNYASAQKLIHTLLASSEQSKSWDNLRLDLAQTYILQSDYITLANKETKIDVPVIYQDAFYQVCDIKTLIDIVNNPQSHAAAREMARNEVFYRYILSGDFKGLYALFQTIDNVGEYSLIETAARVLATDYKDSKGLLNLAFFMLRKMMPPPYDIDNRLKTTAQAAAQCPTIYFKKNYFAPKEYLNRVVDLHNGDKKSVTEAKALHYLTECAKPGWNNRACDWGEPSAKKGLSSEQAFNRLHKKYPDSKWAKKTPYFYND